MRTLVFRASGLTPNRLRLRRNKDSRPWIAGAILLLGLTAISSLFPQRQLAFPVLAVLDAPVNFGTVSVGRESIQYFKIKNDGGADLAIGGVRLVGAERSDFNVSKACDGQVLRPLGECSVKVSFKPQASSALPAELQVRDKSGERELRLIATAALAGVDTTQGTSTSTTNTAGGSDSTPTGSTRGSDTGPASGSVTGLGSPPKKDVPPPPVFKVGFDPQSLIFPDVRVGDSLNKSLVVINQGDALQIRSISLSGEHRDDFTFSDAACTQRLLAPHSRGCTLTVVFRPSDPGSHDATLVVSDSQGMDHPVRLSGIALPPRIPIATLDPPTLDLSDSQPIGSVRVRNTGGGVLQIGQPLLSGQNKNDFEVSACGRIALQNGEEPCLVQVRYKPGILARGRGYSVADLSLSNNTSNSPASATIIGRTEHNTRINPALEQLIGVAVVGLLQQHGRPSPDTGNVKPTGVIVRPQTQYQRPTSNDAVR